MTPAWLADWCRMLVNLLIALQQQSEAQGYKSQAADAASKAPSPYQACTSSYIPVLIGGVRLFSSLLWGVAGDSRSGPGTSLLLPLTTSPHM